MNTSRKSRTKKFAGNSVRTGVALGCFLLSGCTGFRHGLCKSGYGVVKTIDGVARIGTGASVCEKLGIYSENLQEPNYKSPEFYTGESAGSRIGYTLMVPVRAVRQGLEGIGNIAEGIYESTVGQILPQNNTGVMIDEVLNPEKREGIPMVNRGLDYLEEKVGSIEVQEPAKEELKLRLDTTPEKITGIIPVAHPLGDESLSWKQRIPRTIGNGLYYLLFLFTGGNADSGQGTATRNGGSWGNGGLGGK